MTHDLILQHVGKHVSLEKEEAAYFISLLQEVKVPKKGLVLKEGQLCKTISFVNAGALRAYHINKEGKETTVMFALPDWWITDMFCFIHLRPAILNIEAIESSSIFQLKKDDLDTLYLKVPKFERFFRILMQNAYIREQLRMIEKLSLPAEERYIHFLDKYPLIAEKITQKQIASYLGITPEFLSTIRANRAKRIIS
ncbi:Crp/Fnr family transcriptional regulator [Flavitalea sp. BT771]|uniref:Crp/Fnr family transcriptional regulator n=1 Tax=Flavitalea sp. BT771 TaxID=3063329 RepID=UPI0026E35BF4|nr:Crp/Fnr family transcriptional regulator [Flavitalea sp. BT771]MDO6434536.1 Crp/Fnr family transcriptional regulator [Flavitalea sp. BT771]MDV6223436.1 Crp/Fnr family transcriptional regulator [Flavitalea sp. BT771]